VSASRRSASIRRRLVVWCPEASLCDAYRTNARRRLSVVVSYSVPRLIFALFGILCRRRTIGVETLVVGLPASCRMASRDSSSLYLEFSVDVGTIYVATLGVGLPVSCRMASRGSSSLDSESCVVVGTIGVATLGVRLPTSCHMCPKVQ
jgi:hypothetical protein